MSLEQIAYGGGGGLVGAVTLVLIYLKKANSKVSKDTCAATHKALDQRLERIEKGVDTISQDIKALLTRT